MKWNIQKRPSGTTSAAWVFFCSLPLIPPLIQLRFLKSTELQIERLIAIFEVGVLRNILLCYIVINMKFHVITLFGEVCKAYTDASVLGRAQKTDKGKGAKVRGKKIEVNYYNPRDFATNKHNKVDDKPYGGGPGMVIGRAHV